MWILCRRCHSHSTKEFSITADQIAARRFDITEPKKNSFEFIGMETNEKNGVRILSQRSYIRRIYLMPANLTFSDHRSVRAKIQRITHTRPDVACAISQAAQVTESNFNKEHVVALK
jgi:hypothetical protein